MNVENVCKDERKGHLEAMASQKGFDRVCVRGREGGRVRLKRLITFFIHRYSSGSIKCSACGRTICKS